jgi:hypothetical protein
MSGGSKKIGFTTGEIAWLCQSGGCAAVRLRVTVDAASSTWGICIFIAASVRSCKQTRSSKFVICSTSFVSPIHDMC